MKLVTIVSSCNFLEMYNFMLFGYYAPSIGRTFFPTASEFASLMLALATFGAGFLMRPVGAIVLGSYMDRHGRRSGLLLALGMMALGTLTITCMPGYQTAGVVAPLAILFACLLQGLSAGAGVGGVSVYLSEIATAGKLGFYVSWQSASQQVAVVLAALVGIAITFSLSPRTVADWGWRIPFMVGCLSIPALFVMQKTLSETPEFLQRLHRPPGTAEVLRSLAENWRLVGLGMLMATMTTVSFYMITAYTRTYGHEVLHLSLRDSFLVTLCIGLSNFVLLPLMGGLSDRIGRRPQLISCALLALVTGYPALLWMASSPSFGRLLAVELWLSVVYAGYNGAMIVFLIEVMPAKVRASAFSLAYSLATAVFGGFTPAICTWLIHTTGNRAAPGLWLAAAAVCGLLASVLLGRHALAAPALPRIPPMRSAPGVEIHSR